MAINENPQSPRDFRFGFAQQLAFGTAIAPTVDLDGTTPEFGYEIDCDPFDIEYGVTEYSNIGSHGTRSLKDNDYVMHSRRAMPGFSVTGPANHNTLDHFLNSYFQNVTETATTPFGKTFTPHTTQPNFVTAAAVADCHLSTWFIWDPVAGDGRRVKDVLCQTLVITGEVGQPIKITATMVGNGAPDLDQTISGTWTRATTTDLWYFEDLDRASLDFGGGSVNVLLQSFEFTFSRSVIAVGQGDGTGGFSLYGLSGRDLAAKIKVVKDADWNTAVTNFTTDTAISGRIGIGNATAGTDDGDLDFVFRGKATSTPVAYEDIMYGELNMRLLESNDGATKPITIVMANALDRTW